MSDYKSCRLFLKQTPIDSEWIEKNPKLMTELARKSEKHTETKNDKKIQIERDGGELTPEQPGQCLLTLGALGFSWIDLCRETGGKTQSSHG